MAGIEQGDVEPAARDRVLFHEAIAHEVGDRGDAGAREFREVAVVVIGAPGFVGVSQRIAGQHRKAGKRTRKRRQAADPKGIEPPQRVHQRKRDEAGRYHRPAQSREDREQERGGVAVDHHQVDEVDRHLRNVVLEPRQQHQHHDHGQRQRARQSGPAQQRDPERVEDAPAQDEAEPRAEIGLGLQHQHQPGELRCGDGKQPDNAE